MSQNEQLSTTVIDRGSSGIRSIQELQERQRTIAQVMANVLEEGKDYGKIPGTDKPTLFKPGAEKLMLTFQLSASEPTVADLSTADEIRYRVSVPIEGPDGRVLAVGVGEASSSEEKYRWRKPVCDQEWEETPEHLRREKWFKGGSNGAWKGKQVRTSPADVANTVLKMAHKRGFIHGTLLATAASSVFNQDLEDFTAELRESIVADDATAGGAPKPQVQRASEKNGGTKPAPSNGGFVTEPRKVKDVRVFGKDKNNYALTLVGDEQEYTTKDATIAKELESFRGTDHLVRVRFENRDWNGKTYHNITSFAIADSEPKPAPAPAKAAGEMTSGEIPWN